MWACAAALLSRQFPSELIRRPVVGTAWVLHALRIRPSAHTLKICTEFQRVYKTCRRNMVFPSGTA